MVTVGSHHVILVVSECALPYDGPNNSAVTPKSPIKRSPTSSAETNGVKGTAVGMLVVGVAFDCFLNYTTSFDSSAPSWTGGGGV